MTPHTSLAPNDVRITVSESHPHIHHPLSVEDIRELLARFPGDVRPDLAGIHLRSGFQEDDIRGSDSEADPLTGRRGEDIGGRLYVPHLMGRYRLKPCEIDLYGIAYDADALKVPVVQLPLLWVLQAGTLAHEIAHCWDDLARHHTDRWGLDETPRSEAYAERMAQEWLLAHAIPYFVERYPDATAAFEMWIQQNIGIRITLARTAEDADRSIWGVFLGLLDICGRWEPDGVHDLRIDLAEQFHFVDDFKPAKLILDGVLRTAPDDVRATILLGDIAVHEQNWPDALAWTSRAIELAPHDLDALDDRIDALMGNEDWEAAIQVCEAALALKPPERRAMSVRLEIVRSLLGCADFAAAVDDCDELLATDGIPLMHRHWTTALKAEALVGLERWDQALAVARGGLRHQPFPPQKAMLTAAAWEAASKLGKGADSVPTARDLDYLRWGGRAKWADSLLEAGLKPADAHPTRRAAELGRKRRGRLVRA